MFNCSVILDGTAQIAGRQIAIISDVETLTYEQLHLATCEFANALIDAGIRPGDRCLLASPNRPEFIIAFFAILKAGAAVVPISILSKRREIAFILEETKAKAMICYEGTSSLSLGIEGREAFEATESCRHFWYISNNLKRRKIDGKMTMKAACESMKNAFENAYRKPEDAAVILYTSGTTGKPKGAVLTHQNIFTSAITAGRLVDMKPNDVSLIVLPMFHCYAQTAQLNSGLYHASTLVLLDRFDPDRVLQAMQDHNVSLFCGVPTMYWSLLHHEGSYKYDLKKIASHLRLGCSGGAPIAAEVLHGVEEKYAFSILEGYGLSETSAMASFNQLHLSRKVGSVGLPVWGMEIAIVNSHMKRLSSGEKGEIVIRGHSVMKCYFNQPELSREAFRGGWLHTGDVGMKDEEGYLYIVDRAKEMILRGGFNVSPREVEEVLARHPAISLSAVIGVPHDKYGEEIVAFAILKKGMKKDMKTSENEIMHWSKKEMANHKYPRQVHIVRSLPLSATGKVLKKELRSTYKKTYEISQKNI